MNHHCLYLSLPDGAVLGKAKSSDGKPKPLQAPCLPRKPSARAAGTSASAPQVGTPDVGTLALVPPPPRRESASAASSSAERESEGDAKVESIDGSTCMPAATRKRIFKFDPTWAKPRPWLKHAVVNEVGRMWCALCTSVFHGKKFVWSAEVKEMTGLSSHPSKSIWEDPELGCRQLRKTSVEAHEKPSSLHAYAQYATSKKDATPASAETEAVQQGFNAPGTNKPFFAMFTNACTIASRNISAKVIPAMNDADRRKGVAGTER